MLILTSPLKKIFPKKTKNHMDLKKRYLSLEKGKLNEKIDLALNKKDYISAMTLIGKIDKIEKKLDKAKQKEKINEAN